MARITRKAQKIFAGSATNNGQFGSAQAGTKVLSNDPDTIQALTAWDEGWLEATISAQKLPPLEEMQGIQYVQTRQIAYLFQEGIPEFNIDTTYYQNSIVKKPGTYELYGSITDDNIGNALPSQTSDSDWQYLGDLSTLFSNVLNNYTATTAPTANDDNVDGYSVGSQWINTSTDIIYQCVDATTAAAVWKRVSVSTDIRTKLSGNADYYVATTGNNSNAGTIGSPWRDIQYAISYVENNLDLNGYTVTINVADGTYTENLVATGSIPGNSSSGFGFVITGNTGSPGNVILSPATGDVLNARFGATVSIGGVKFISSNSNGINSNNGGTVVISNPVQFGACNTAHIYMQQNGRVILNSDYTINGNATYHIYGQENSNISCNGRTVTLTGTPAFGGAYARADNCGTMTLTSNTYSGSATGARYSVNTNSVINTAGAGASALPGNSAGATATGGQYV